MMTQGLSNAAPAGKEIATLAGGCFWCLEAVYDQLKGVISVESGYMGGDLPNPTYEQVCGGDTGHAEVVRITFDPQEVSYADLLDIFFVIHDPTQFNRQGNDAGTQYRSVVFYHSDDQRRIAEETIKALVDNRVYGDPIVTEIAPAAQFYVAEDYHQEYFANNPRQPYCMLVVAPKVAKLRSKFFSRLKK
jgi:peptide-methionine (S)-S-oxide reductase